MKRNSELSKGRSMLNWIDEVRGTGAATPVMVKSSALPQSGETRLRLCPSGSAPPKRR